MNDTPPTTPYASPEHVRTVLDAYDALAARAETLRLDVTTRLCLAHAPDEWWLLALVGTALVATRLYALADLALITAEPPASTVGQTLHLAALDFYVTFVNAATSTSALAFTAAELRSRCYRARQDRAYLRLHEIAVDPWELECALAAHDDTTRFHVERTDARTAWLHLSTEDGAVRIILPAVPERVTRVPTPTTEPEAAHA